ncbi:hypothetical protein [Sapientia aquatica]|uniref:Uncharacterized protein n=1 Tax=Sapientia aquatica TaxID=1549640 RepID=A0A4R5W3R8_9BURK|nr:hypothetical protein [Sapientia aquatica]TDK65979.1 hypothetical protein E2I14_10315 [Sapientia aquatica]
MTTMLYDYHGPLTCVPIEVDGKVTEKILFPDSRVELPSDHPTVQNLIDLGLMRLFYLPPEETQNSMPVREAPAPAPATEKKTKGT